jgi:methylthioribulose-1-phosphate dehydratase
MKAMSFLTEPAAIQTVIALARYCGSRHWIPATAGNFSARIDKVRVAITATGADKTQLTEAGVITVDMDDDAAGSRHKRLSAEGPLHLQIYRDHEDAGAVAHAHPLSAVALSRKRLPAGEIAFEGWELQKAIRGIVTHESRIVLPVFANDQDTDRLAREVSARWASIPGPCFGYLIAGHGIYTWGRTGAEARRHLEAYEHLLTLAYEEERRA